VPSKAQSPNRRKLLKVVGTPGLPPLKITDVHVIVTCPGRNYVLVKILTNEPGLYGVGDATLNGRELAVATTLEKHLAPLLIGRDPEAIEDTWQYLYRGAYWRGGPAEMTALAGIDLALWDIKGKRAGMPVYQLLGGRTRHGALAYTHVNGKTFTEVEEAARQAMERGFKVLRAQVAIPGLREPMASPPWGESFTRPTCRRRKSLSLGRTLAPSPTSSRTCARPWVTESNSSTMCTKSSTPLKRPAWQKSWSLSICSISKIPCGPSTRRASA
jgi:hypothetical protein